MNKQNSILPAGHICLTLFLATAQWGHNSKAIRLPCWLSKERVLAQCMRCLCKSESRLSCSELLLVDTMEILGSLGQDHLHVLLLAARFLTAENGGMRGRSTCAIGVSLDGVNLDFPGLRQFQLVTCKCKLQESWKYKNWVFWHSREDRVEKNEQWEY